MATIAKQYEGSCECPSPDLLGTENKKCKKHLLQFVRFAVMKSAGVDPFDGTAGKTITVEADWITAFAAAGDDKLVISPAFSSTTLTGGEMQVVGENSNESAYGAGENSEHTFSVLAGSFKGYDADNIQKLMVMLNCNEALKFFLVNNKNEVFYVADVAAATAMLSSLSSYLNAPTTQGLNTLTEVPFAIKFEADVISYMDSVNLPFIRRIDN